MKKRQMNIFYVMSLIFLFNANFLFAQVSVQDEEMKVKGASKSHRTSSGKKIIKISDEVLADSSEVMRDGKSYDLVAELIGFSVYPFVSMGVTAGYYLDMNDVLELNYAAGSLPLFFFNAHSEV